MKVALIHDALNVYGGAEKVLEEFHAMFPSAPVFVPTYRPETFPSHFRDWDVRSTWMNRLPLAKSFHRVFFPIYPLAMHGIDLSAYDLVLSSSFNFAHNVVTDPETCHVCYCHSPARFLWDSNGYANREGFGPLKRAVITALLPRLRALDRSAAQGVDYWISTSRLVESRIRKIYRRRSVVVPPPVNLAEFHTASKHDGYYLLVMRLVGWKRADIAIEACNALRLPLVVAGEGRDCGRLKALAGPTIRFVGRVDGAAKAELYAKCAAFILPSAEDFGITPLEAMASGRPVIALGQGGALDTVEPGITGEFFPEQDSASLVHVLRTFDPDRYDPARIRAHAASFDRTHFRRRMTELLESSLRHHRAGLRKGSAPRQHGAILGPREQHPDGIPA